MRYPIRKSAGAPRRGIALIAVLVVVAVLALAAYRFGDLMMAESQAADSYTRSQKAQAAAISGLNYFMAQLAAYPFGTNPASTPSGGTTQTTQTTQTGGLGNLYGNTSLFQGILLQDGDENHQRVRFSLVSPLDPDALASSNGTSNNGSGVSQNFRYGVVDEASKINVNALFKLDSSGQTLYNTLMQLPNMTDAIANSIIYWIDPNATPRSSAATDEYYMTLDPPYHAKNAPLDSIEELLYIQGVTPQLLFGNDKNRNGQLDPGQDDGTGQLDQGWFPYLTMYSRELNVSSSGAARVWVNDPNLQGLQQDLTDAGLADELVSFIIAWRMYGGTSTTPANGSSGSGGASPSGSSGSTPSSGGTPAGSGGMTIGLSMGGDGSQRITIVSSAAPAAQAGKKANGPLTSGALGNLQGKSGGNTISSLYALINSQVTVPASDGSQPTIYTSPMSDTGTIRQYLPQVLDLLTTNKASNLPARININTAPSAVLSALSSGSSTSSTQLLDPTTLQTILSTRPPLNSTQAPDPIFQTPAWLITEASLPVATVQKLDQYITARSQVYRVQSVGHFDSGGASARVEAVIDSNGGRPRIVYYRDLTGLGKAYDLPKNP